MSEATDTSRQRFDRRLREALAACLGETAAPDAVDALGAEDRQALSLHARILGWEAPQRLLQMHDAACAAVGGQGHAFEALAQLGQWCWNHSDAPDNAVIRDILKAAVLHPAAMAAVEATAVGLRAGLDAARPVSGQRIAFLVSSLVPGAATTYVMRALAPDLAARGWQVDLVATSPADDCEPGMRAELDAAGARILLPPAGTDHVARARWIAARLQERAPAAVIHYVWPHDYVGKLVCNLRLAPLQVFINHTCDQPTGDFDLKIGYSGDYRGHHLAERYVTLPNCSVRAAHGRRVQPFDRAQLGLPPDAVWLATFSRLAKCVDEPFLRAMCQILNANPKALWLLVGGRDPACEAQINSALVQAGVADRVVYTGFMQGDDYFRLLRTVDIYCDTITWMGGQTVADAVACGLPVVCCAPQATTALAPHGNNPTVLASELLAPGSLVAAGGDAQDYARLAQAYIDDTPLRAHAAAINHASVDDDAWPAYVRKFDFLLRAVLPHKLRGMPASAGTDGSALEAEAGV